MGLGLKWPHEFMFESDEAVSSEDDDEEDEGLFGGCAITPHPQARGQMVGLLVVAMLAFLLRRGLPVQYASRRRNQGRARAAPKCSMRRLPVDSSAHDGKGRTMIAVLGLAVAMVLMPMGAKGATVVVNTRVDDSAAGDGRCTLREAIANVNAGGETTGGDCAAGSGGGDVIAFDLRSPARIRLLNGEIEITRDVRIAGPSAGKLIVHGNNRSRVFRISAGAATMSDVDIHGGRVSPTTAGDALGGGVLVEEGASLDLRSCTLDRNAAIARTGRALGGGLYVAGTVKLSNCTLTRNTARGSLIARGGALYIAGTGTLTNCLLRNNAARDLRARHTTSEGGALHVSGNVDLTNCTLRDNRARGGAAGRGGGMFVMGEATLKDSSLVKNVARGFVNASGGGMSLIQGATGAIRGSSVLHNSARGVGGGGGIDNHAALIVENSTISGNRSGFWGGGIFNGGNLSLRHCTLSDNASHAGGGLFNVKLATLSSCTLSNNTSRGERGGAIFNEGGFFQSSQVSLTNCTLSRNRAAQGGGGIYTGFQLVRTEVLNTIIALNEPDDCGPRTTSNGHNLDSDGTCFAGGATDLVNTEPLLAPLYYYGGSLQTMALCSAPGIPHPSCSGASPAIDAGDDAVLDPPTELVTDQRGLPRLSGAHVDIGGYEVQQ